MTTVVDSEKKAKTILGIDPKKVNREHLDAAAKALGIEPNGLSHTIQKVSALFVERAKGEPLMHCDVCGGHSPKEFSECPFCGVGEDPPATAMVVAKGAHVAEVVSSEDAAKLLGPGERQLDEAVARINEAKILTAVGYFQLCKEIEIVVQSQLYKARRDAEGRPKYKTFAEFAELELKMSKGHAWSMAQIPSRYSIEQVKIIGRNKCELLLTAPKEKHPELVDAALKGESTRKLTAKVRELNLGRPKKGGAPQKTEKIAERKDELTLALIVGKKHVLPCFKPGKVKEGEKPEPAKKVDDQPWAFRDLPNGIREIFRVAKFPSGQLKILIEAKREE
jgi:hypothetical protein